MAGTITHSWKGTVLTITSDAGTSSMDLAGATGCRGPQGRPGVVYDNEGKILIADLASLEYVDAELNKYDKKTLIRDENGKLKTAIGGFIVEKVESELVDSIDNIVCSPMLGDIYFVVSGIDFSRLTANAYYNIHITLGNGAEIELKHIQYQNSVFQSIAGNEYVTATKFAVGGSSDYFIIKPVDIDFWTAEALTVSRFEIKTYDYCIYDPIDGRALPVDNNNITLNEHSQLTVGPNVVVESRMTEYVEEQISLAQIGGEDPTAVLANYYTKAQVDARIDARIAEELAKITSGEEVDY